MHAAEDVDWIRRARPLLEAIRKAEIEIEDHVVLAALGIAGDGKKHVLGMWEGATENATACKGLLGTSSRATCAPSRRCWWSSTEPRH